jgi:hypothetical protein
MEMHYVSPEMDVMDVMPEGVLCTSGNSGTENLDENEGIW